MAGKPTHWFLWLLALGALMLAWPAAAQTPPEEASWFIDMSRFRAGAHAKLDCAECHPKQQKAIEHDDPLLPHPDPASAEYLKNPALRGYDYSLCQRCHRLAWQRYNQGAHAKALDENLTTTPGKHKAPVCGDCHDAHYVKAGQDRVAMGRQQTQTCGACHPSQAATYLSDYHGKAGDKLGWDKAAFCSDCHGAHKCISLKKAKTAAPACRRCHPGVNQRFAQYLVHTSTDDPAQDSPVKRKALYLIFTLTAIMAVIAICVVGFFYGHTFLWLLREVHHKLRRH